MAKEKKQKILVLGVGNILRRDDGFGVRVLEYIKERYDVPSGVELFDGGTGGIALTSIIGEHKKVIILDAVSAGGVPGDMHRITKKDIAKTRGKTLSPHSFGVEEALTLTGFEGKSPDDLVLIGVEPLDTTSGLELSPLLKLRLPMALEMLKKELKRHGAVMKAFPR
ncbi:MAG TPA: HyaD/HybD family hydrogenase maturation endopeptidase [Thermodesulfobacteriota bacterium]|nr:HyaD/HybD family hydrogenase maturation endopeptidase [Thermodesulfobacteriota bacterium]